MYLQNDLINIGGTVRKTGKVLTKSKVKEIINALINADRSISIEQIRQYGLDNFGLGGNIKHIAALKDEILVECLSGNEGRQSMLVEEIDILKARIDELDAKVNDLYSQGRSKLNVKKRERHNPEEKQKVLDVARLGLEQGKTKADIARELSQSYGVKEETIRDWLKKLN